MAVGSNRMLGGIGALLLVVSAASPLLILPRFLDLYSTSSAVSPFSWVFGLAGLAGLILFMVTMRGFASDYRDLGIFNNALYGVLSRHNRGWRLNAYRPLHEPRQLDEP